jgi:ribonuclease HI
VPRRRPYLRRGVAERKLWTGALSLLGAIERVTIEWQEGELEASVEEVVDHLVAFFLAAGSSFGLTRR